jgi:endo-1,4-beta-D-glucanase Y
LAIGRRRDCVDRRGHDADGRIVDDANNNISHSEGQGYGLLLAVLALDRPTFTKIWSFTKTQQLLRDDGLVAWRWDPAASPHVGDANNASDGDILIAYALALAGESWTSPELTAAAQDLARAIGRVLVKRVDDRTVLMPAAKGFGPGERPDGPVVNLSYWIFEALPVLAKLAPDTDWSALADSGRDLVLASRFGPDRLPANWISIHAAAPAPALGFDPLFGYDAIRIPLYLVRAGLVDRSVGAVRRIMGVAFRRACGHQPRRRRCGKRARRPRISDDRRDRRLRA